MSLRPLTVIALILAASPAAAEDIRLFAPAPNGPTPVEQAPRAEAVRLFSPAPKKPLSASPAVASQPKAPPIRGAVREKAIPAEALPADRTWTVALP